MITLLEMKAVLPTLHRALGGMEWDNVCKVISLAPSSQQFFSNHQLSATASSPWRAGRFTLKEMRSTLEIATLRSGQMNSLGMKPRYVCCNSDSWDQDLRINPEIRFSWGYISAGTKKQHLRRNLWGKLCGDLLNKSRPILPGLNVLVNLSEPKWTQLTYIPIYPVNNVSNVKLSFSEKFRSFQNSKSFGLVTAGRTLYKWPWAL